MRATAFIFSILASAALAQDEPTAPVADSEPTAPVTAGAPPATTNPAAATTPDTDAVKAMSGMSILGNEEAPKSLVIVPWKSSRLGDEPGVSNALDERPRPLDKEVFMRELRYFSLRSGSE